MPIVYESPAPIGIAANTYDRTTLLQQQLLAQQLRHSQTDGYGGGPGGGNRGGGSDIQAAINNRDQMQAQQNQANFAANGVSQSQVYASQSQAAQQQQAAQLQAQLQQTELTQSENMRLTRMKNAIGDVQNDPTLSTEEKNNYTMQLRTGIDPMEKRQQLANLKAQELLNTSKSNENDQQTAFKNRSLKISAMAAPDRRVFSADPAALASIVSDLKSVHPEMSQEDAGKLAQETALAQNLGVHGTLQPDGKIEYDTHLNPDGTPIGKGGASGSGSSGGGSGSPGQLDLKQWLDLRKHAEDAIRAKGTEKKDSDIPGIKVDKHPELADAAEFSKAVIQHLRDMKVPATFDEFQGQQKPQEKKGYDPSKAPWNKNRVATVATPEVPTPAGQVNGVSPAAIDKKSNERVNDILTRPDLPQAVKLQAGEKIGVMRRLFQKTGGNIAKLTEGERAQWNEADKYLKDNVPDQVGAPAGEQQPATSAPPAAAPERGFFGNAAQGASDVYNSIGNSHFEAPTIPHWMKLGRHR